MKTIISFNYDYRVHIFARSQNDQNRWYGLFA